MILVLGFARAEDKKITCPDGKLVVTVFVENGSPFYSVSLNNKQFLEKSPLGINTSIGDFSSELTLNDTVAIKKITDVGGAVCLYLFAVQMATAQRPFFQGRMFRDRNFVVGQLFIFVFGGLLFATLALLVAAVIWPAWLIYPAGFALVLANAWLLRNLFSALGVYRDHLARIAALEVHGEGGPTGPS